MLVGELPKPAVLRTNCPKSVRFHRVCTRHYRSWALFSLVCYAEQMINVRFIDYSLRIAAGPPGILHKLFFCPASSRRILLLQS